VREIKSIAKEIILDQKQQDMFKWLSPLNPSAKHLESEKKRVKGTGTWMLEDPKFLDWFSKTAKCQTLCCYGAPGAGKTIIS
jgi:SpoVK/Ycf46/Vps4 family AAA+-type ATPase